MANKKLKKHLHQSVKYKLKIETTSLEKLEGHSVQDGVQAYLTTVEM